MAPAEAAAVTAALACLLAASLQGAAAPPGSLPAAIPIPPPAREAAAVPRRARAIVILRTERWIDTVRGTLKNAGARPAMDVVLTVRLRNARGTVLGTETVPVGPLAPGEEKEFQLALPEKLRSAARWEITPRAVFGPRAGQR